MEGKSITQTIVGGLALGAAIGIAVRFATDGKTLAYAAGGAIVVGGLFAIGAVVFPKS